MHLPGLPRYLVQKLDIGLHWKIRNISCPKVNKATIMTTIQIVIFWYRFTHIWRSKAPMAAFTTAVVVTYESSPAKNHYTQLE